MFWFKKSKFNGREYREETSRKISWGHWFAFFNIIIAILIGSRYAFLMLTCKDKLIHYYAKFGFVNEGVSASVHGNVTWYQMRLSF